MNPSVTSLFPQQLFTSKGLKAEGWEGGRLHKNLTIGNSWGQIAPSCCASGNAALEHSGHVLINVLVLWVNCTLCDTKTLPTTGTRYFSERRRSLTLSERPRNFALPSGESKACFRRSSMTLMETLNPPCQVTWALNLFYNWCSPPWASTHAFLYS